jgi:hypothetical protein
VIVTVTVAPAVNPDTVKLNKPYGKETVLGGGVEILLRETAEKLSTEPALNWAQAVAPPFVVGTHGIGLRAKPISAAHWDEVLKVAGKVVGEVTPEVEY